VVSLVANAYNYEGDTMGTTRRKFSAEMKASAALAAIKGQQTINEIAADYGVHPNQVAQWKKQVLDQATTVFARPASTVDDEALKARLYQEIGQLKVELDWLKKNVGKTVEGKRALIEPAHPQVSVARQCALVGLPRSSWYYHPVPIDAETDLLLRLLDEQYTRTPFYGIRRMTAWLHPQGWAVNHKRVRRLLRQMGLMALFPGPRLSVPHPDHRIYPYLLRGVPITRVNQVWSTDISYIRLHGGFIYLTAVIDWCSRYVLAWEVSNTLDGSFCLAALDRALARGTPEIFNTDQGAQFTSLAFTGRLLDAGIQISMDGRGRALDNIFVERLWRTVKYEEVYLKDYASMGEAVTELRDYLRFYNEERLHQSLGYCPPATVWHAA